MSCKKAYIEARYSEQYEITVDDGFLENHLLYYWANESHSAFTTGFCKRFFCAHKPTSIGSSNG